MMQMVNQEDHRLRINGRQPYLSFLKGEFMEIMKNYETGRMYWGGIAMSCLRVSGDRQD
jgi:hypothetical protein